MFYFGVDYYPEHWPEERWEEDARLMAEANFNVVRLAEFAWSKLEPEEGKFDFDWLDRAISILLSRDIKVVLGTPTASPPPWVMAKGEDLYLVGHDGHRLTYGNRREYCPNNSIYREHARRIVDKMADHYVGHSGVIGWQIDNEFGSRCYCDICKGKFQQWLISRFHTLDELNEKWGTVFWSHTYNQWSEIPVPISTGNSPNPSLALDYYRFMTDSYLSFQKEQVDILRQKCADHFITHNLMGFKYDQLDYFKMNADLDFVSWDIYWRTQWNMFNELDPSYAALGHDTMRGLKKKNFWVMEQQSGAGGWEFVAVPPKPGELRLWAYQSIAHGADGIVFFRWRTSRFGTEQYWHGVLDHHGAPGRRYAEIKKMGAEINKIGDQIQGAIVKSEVAMLLSYDSRFAFQIQPHNPRFDYPSHFQDIYRAFYYQNVSVDVVAPTSDLSEYKIVLAPALHIVSDEVADNLEGYVKGGGRLVLTPRSGVKDTQNVIVDKVLPGLLADLCGIEIEEYVSMPIDMDGEIIFTCPEFNKELFRADTWCDVLKPKGARVIALYQHDYLRGKPAITLNEYGNGSVVYMGTIGGSDLYSTVGEWLIGIAGVKPYLTSSVGVEIAERWQDGKKLIFLMNYADEEKEIELENRYTNLLDGSSLLEGRITIVPKDVLILYERGG
ncbi:MAG: beta-galactosidase [Anaerolineales bacterium]|jgi:beta-galactosidase